MKIKRIVTILLTAMMVLSLAACGSRMEPARNSSNTEPPQNGKEISSGSTDKGKGHLSQITDWKTAGIPHGAYDFKFQDNPFLVENTTYCFYLSLGEKMRVIRINKATKEKRVIMELEVKKWNTARICLADEGLIVGYAKNLYWCDVDGKGFKQILSKQKLEKLLMQMKGFSKVYIEGDCVRGMQFYKGELYFIIVPFYLVKLNLQTKRLTKLAEFADRVCFCGSKIYYKNGYDEAVYRADLDGKNKEIILGEESKSDKKIYYGEVLEVEGKIYYLSYSKKGNVTLFLYREGKADKEIYRFDNRKYFQGAVPNSSKIICEYLGNNYGANGNHYIQIYDIKTNCGSELIQMKNVGEAANFYSADDLLFYAKKDSDDYFSLKKIELRDNKITLKTLQ